jgi:hypothetical protein
MRFDKSIRLLNRNYTIFSGVSSMMCGGLEGRRIKTRRKWEEVQVVGFRNVSSPLDNSRRKITEQCLRLRTPLFLSRIRDKNTLLCVKIIEKFPGTAYEQVLWNGLLLPRRTSS